MVGSGQSYVERPPVAALAEVRALFDGRNYAHVATLMPDGAPQSIPLWVGVAAGRIVVCLIVPEHGWTQAFG
jgi:hypothetical protein